MPETMPGPNQVVLHLIVNDHPGVMSHVCGLFARRAFNLEGILVAPSKGRPTCRMWLLVSENQRLEQIISQVRKLHDVCEVTVSRLEPEAFDRLADCLEP